MSFVIKQNDRREPIDRTLRGSDGAVVNLSGASVKFLMRPQGGGALKVNAAATIVDAALGKVRYSWAAGDTDTVGAFDAEFEVTFADGTVQTFPNGRYLSVVVVEDLG